VHGTIFIYFKQFFKRTVKTSSDIISFTRDTIFERTVKTSSVFVQTVSIIVTSRLSVTIVIFCWKLEPGIV